MHEDFELCPNCGSCKNIDCCWTCCKVCGIYEGYETPETVIRGKLGIPINMVILEEDWS